jgi:hypothetical protein
MLNFDAFVAVDCDQRLTTGVAPPSALVNLEGVAEILFPRGVTAVELEGRSPDGVMSHLLLRGVSPAI